jgi:conserved oligomeric Golgi complex subunit 2
LKKKKKKKMSKSFQVDQLLLDDWSAERFVQECLMRTSISSLSTELRAYGNSVDSELEELINREYATFVKLSTDLAGLDSLVNRIERPLDTLKNEVNGAWIGVGSALAEVERMLDERKSVREQRKAIEMCLGLERCVVKVENLVQLHFERAPSSSRENRENHRGHDDDNEDEDDSVNIGRAEVLERMANDLNEIHYYLSEAREFAFVDAMRERVGAVEQLLQRHLEALFGDAVASGGDDDRTLVANCLRTFAAMGEQRVADAERIFSERVAVPFAERVIAASRLAESGGLAAMYDDVARFAANAKVLRAAGDVRQFDLLSRSLWRAVQRAIFERVPSIFAIGIPELFFRHYMLSLDLLHRLESTCASLDAVMSFRQCQATVDFLKRWNVPVYFSLRFQQIVTPVHEAAELADIQVLSTSESQFSVAVVQHAWHALCQCFGAEVFVPTAADRFFRLALEVLARVRSWLVDRLAPLPASTMLTVVADVDRLVAAVDSTRFADIVAAVVHEPHLDQASLLPIVARSFHQASVSLRSSLIVAAQACVDSVASQCAERLQPMLGIAQTYRMMDRPAPRNPSPYVGTVLEPLAELLSNATQANVADDLRQQWALGAAQSIVERFVTLSNKFLSKVSKQSDTLSRFLKKKSKDEVSASSSSSSAAAATAAQSINELTSLSDQQKIDLQLYLDVDAFGKQLAELIVVADLPKFVELLDLVASGRRIHEQLQDAKK